MKPKFKIGDRVRIVPCHGYEQKYVYKIIFIAADQESKIRYRLSLIKPIKKGLQRSELDFWDERNLELVDNGLVKAIKRNKNVKAN